MSPGNQSLVTVSTEQTTAQSTVGPFNNGMKPQGSTTPDSNSSTKETLTMEEKNLSVSASSASTMEKTNSTMGVQPLNIIGAASFSEENATVESPNADKEVEENLLLTRSTLPKHGSYSAKLHKWKSIFI
ncbi:MAG: hypothetical protein HP047_09125 [Lachnospira sp.]|nr:hypothetical protein [Lachnospira sp.]